MLNKKIIPIIAVVFGFIMFLGIAITTNLFSSGDLPVQISGALLEAVVTALITYFLLTGQTTQEEMKEKQVKVFEKKQEVYHNFLEELKRIIQDGEIKILAQGKATDSDKNVDELKDLIFQLSYLQMHTSKDNIEKVFQGVAEIIKQLKLFSSSTDKQALLPDHYATISEELFKIVAILKSDLYGKESLDNVEKEKMQSILRELDFVIDNQDGNLVISQNILEKKNVFTSEMKKEIQNYFWSEMRTQLQKRGYTCTITDNIAGKINGYYSTTRRNKHRFYGIDLEIYKSKINSQAVNFRIEIGDSYYYGFKRDVAGEVNELLIKFINEISIKFSQTQWWYGWKTSDKYDLNFWYFNSKGFESLSDPKKRELYMKELVDEIEDNIKKFVEIAKVNNF